MKVLVCGGAGYIGSHMVQLLMERGHIPITFDNLSTGHSDAVGHTTLVVGDVLDDNALDGVFSEHGPFDLVMHFCAKSLVVESVQKPHLYYENNVIGTLRLLDAMRRHNHSRIVFSSTAATYGIPQSELIDEQHQCVPINPYGNTKLVIEGVLQDYHAAYNIRSLSFRYFNACGAHPTAGIGERHDPETHLIPNVLKSLLDGGQKLKVFGGDYKTPDGSCVRDYVHVGDLCGAHLAAATYLDANDGAFVMNLGNGDGFSVLEIIKAVERVTGRTVAYDMEGRRPGDPPTLVANAALATESLNWTPKFDTIESIIETAWQFHQNT
jgi:UDP-glucose 4-epimerase|tara:strand:+ start:5372 stop:6343 length:972 start_codon:yes stop_codon:yes gene_type:complete